MTGISLYITSDFV